jgi:hypothetical protein
MTGPFNRGLDHCVSANQTGASGEQGEQADQACEKDGKSGHSKLLPME